MEINQTLQAEYDQLLAAFLLDTASYQPRLAILAGRYLGPILQFGLLQ